MIKALKDNNFNLHPLLKNYDENRILDYRNITRIKTPNNESLCYVPQLFLGKIVFISFNSFQQNNKKLGDQIRRFVYNSIQTDTINAIGGESLYYDQTKKCKVYTNSESIIKDAVYNKYKNIHLIDYNTDKIELLSKDTILNLSRLNTNLLTQINHSKSDKIIIINCHHKDFWKKIKLLTNYNIIQRKHFIDHKSKYFITVTILKKNKINFVSLGGNCAVTYHLNRLKLRHEAYPFDWCKIKLPKLIKAFKEDFKEYDKLSIKKFSEAHEDTFLIENLYGNFAHEV